MNYSKLLKESFSHIKFISWKSEVSAVVCYVMYVRTYICRSTKEKLKVNRKSKGVTL